MSSIKLNKVENLLLEPEVLSDCILYAKKFPYVAFDLWPNPRNKQGWLEWHLVGNIKLHKDAKPTTVTIDVVQRSVSGSIDFVERKI